ncbi:MAG TPA: GNAT family N-acetyltransferase [Methylomirabilota bacterium]
MTDWSRVASRVDQAHEAIGHRSFEGDGGVFVTNAELPDIHVANYVHSITAKSPGEIDGLLARAEREFAGCPHRCFEVDRDTSPKFEGRLVSEGYEAREFVLMMLEGKLVGKPPAADLRLATDDRDWAAADRLKRLDWAEARAKLGRDPLPAVGESLARLARLKTPPDRKWLARMDGEARGMASVWDGLDGVGYVEDVFVEPAYRHRGLATALLHRCAADARARGIGALTLVADAADTPQAMYAAMGFRHVATKRRYVRYPKANC